jgi:hypothetical protein
VEMRILVANLAQGCPTTGEMVFTKKRAASLWTHAQFLAIESEVEEESLQYQ